MSGDRRQSEYVIELAEASEAAKKEQTSNANGLDSDSKREFSHVDNVRIQVQPDADSHSATPDGKRSNDDKKAGVKDEGEEDAKTSAKTAVVKPQVPFSELLFRFATPGIKQSVLQMYIHMCLLYQFLLCLVVTSGLLLTPHPLPMYSA
eukprot:Opistho-2@44974